MEHRICTNPIQWHMRLEHLFCDRERFFSLRHDGCDRRRSIVCCARAVCRRYHTNTTVHADCRLWGACYMAQYATRTNGRGYVQQIAVHVGMGHRGYEEIARAHSVWQCIISKFSLFFVPSPFSFASKGLGIPVLIGQLLASIKSLSHKCHPGRSHLVRVPAVTTTSNITCL